MTTCDGGPVREVRLSGSRVPEGGVAVVARPAEPGVAAAMRRGATPVAVEGQEGIVELGEGPEVRASHRALRFGDDEVEELCRSRGVDLLVASMPVDEDYRPLEVPRLVRDSALRRPRRHRSPDLGPGALPCWSTSLPLVLVDADAENVRFDAVVSDDVDGARAAVERLLRLGGVATSGSVGTRETFLPRRPPAPTRPCRGDLAEASLVIHYVEASHSEPDVAGVAAADYLARKRSEGRGGLLLQDDESGLRGAFPESADASVQRSWVRLSASRDFRATWTWLGS